MNIDLEKNTHRPSLVSKAFSDRTLFYKGVNVFDAYLASDSFNHAFNEMHEDIEAQECYLGYLPDTDQFISGHDVWFDETVECPECEGAGDIEHERSDDNQRCGKCDGECFFDSGASDDYMGNAFLFTMDEDDGDCAVIDTVAAIGRMFYSDGMYKYVHDLYPNIIDVRLD